MKGTALFFFILLPGTETMTFNTRLVKDLMTDYEVQALPVSDPTAHVDVRFELVLRNIISFDIREQLLSCSVWLRTYWNDTNLRWNPENYGGITDIHFKSTMIWTPDLTLYEQVNVDKTFMASYAVKVASDGRAGWLAPAVITFACGVDITPFPFDEQKCSLTWGAWAYDGSFINLYNGTPGISMEYFEANSEYEVTPGDVDRQVKRYSCCENTYITLVYPLHLRRLSLYYIITIILPCAAISMIAGFTFILSHESGERLSLSVTMLLASTVYMLIVSETMPVQSLVVPLISRYFLGVLIALGSSTFATIISLNIHNSRDVRRLPKWFRVVVFRYFAKLLCMDGTVQVTETDPDHGSIRPDPKLQQEADVKVSLQLQNKQILADTALAARIFDRIMLVIFVVAFCLCHCVFFL